jgi:hypothetical protein
MNKISMKHQQGDYKSNTNQKIEFNQDLNDSFCFENDDVVVFVEYSLPANSEQWGHYLSVVLCDGRYCEWPSESPYASEYLAKLEKALGTSLKICLGGSNVLTSNIIWPAHLQGAQAVVFCNEATSFFKRALHKFTGPKFSLYWSDTVLAEMERRKNARNEPTGRGKESIVDKDG